MRVINSFEHQVKGVTIDEVIDTSNGEHVPVYKIDSFHVLTQFVGSQNM